MRNMCLQTQLVKMACFEGFNFNWIVLYEFIIFTRYFWRKHNWNFEEENRNKKVKCNDKYWTFFRIFNKNLLKNDIK